MDIEAYLERIGVEREGLRADAHTLRLLQRSHLRSVSFENLDIHWKHPIVIDTEKFFEKIVTGKRGGFCYELNGLFNELLRELGFRTRLISARVFNGKEHGREFDHAAILVDVEGETYLADVGFGEFAEDPLRFDAGVEQADAAGTFLIERTGDGSYDVRMRTNDGWVSRYAFEDKERELPEFAEMCDFQQHSPESHFTKNKICSVLTADGRKTLTSGKFIVTSRGARTETAVAGDAEFERILAAEFGIVKLQ